MPQSENCHKDRGPTVNKAIIVSRHVGRRYPTTNQRNTKMIVITMIMIIVIIIIINIIMSMGLPNALSRSKHAGGKPPNPHHTTGRGETTHNHTTPQGGGTMGGGGRGRAGGIIYTQKHIQTCVCVCIHMYIRSESLQPKALNPVSRCCSERGGAFEPKRTVAGIGNAGATRVCEPSGFTVPFLRLRAFGSGLWVGFGA